MKIIFALLIVFVATASAVRLFHRDQVLRTYPTESQREFLSSIAETYDIDFWTHNKGPLDIHVPRIYVPLIKVILQRNRIDHEIFIEDLQTAIDSQTEDRERQLTLDTFNYNVYHTLDEINAWMNNMASEYSSLISVVPVGQSYEGRSISGLKISTGSGKPAFVMNCGIHAREWVSPASCMYAVKYFAEATSGSTEYQLLQSIDVYVVPSSNPDGYQYTWDSDRMWRKTRSDNNKACMGVDPNRNFDINWSGPGASASSCNDAYYGPSVFSEIEDVSQRDFVASIPNVQGYIDIHSYSQLWMFPWGYTSQLCADNGLLDQIGSESVAAIKAVHGMVYESGPISRVIYQASGSTADYFYDNGIKCSFAVELRDTGTFGFTLPERFIQPTAEETFAGLKVIATHIANGSCA